MEVDAKNEKAAGELALKEIEENYGYDDVEIGLIDELKIIAFRVDVEYQQDGEAMRNGFDYQDYHQPREEELKSTACKFFGLRSGDIIEVKITKK